MTKLHKTISGSVFVIFSGLIILETRQVALLQNQIQILQQQQAPLVEQFQQLQSERNTARHKLAMLREDNKRLVRNTAEMLTLQKEVDALQANSQKLGLLKRSFSEQANYLTPDAVTNWLIRTYALRRRIEKMPDAQIPESQFLRDTDWLEVARRPHLDTDAGMAGAAEQLRSYAKNEFARLMVAALKNFIETNGGELPTQVAQLKSFFPVAVPDELLERYKMLHSGNVKDVPEYDRKNRLVTERKSAADGSDHTMMRMGTVSWSRLAAY